MNQLSDWYDRRHDRLRLARVVARCEDREITPSGRGLEVDGGLPRTPCVVSTAGQGILLFDGGQVRQLFAGRFYGLARVGSEWYAFERQRLHGRIIRFDLSGWGEVVAYGLSRGGHQLAATADQRGVILADTYENRLIVFPRLSLAQRAYWRDLEHTTTYPDGRLARGRRSANYRHFNSIEVLGPEDVVLVAHNESYKTGRPSELWWREDGRWRVEQLPASNAHNVLVNESGVWVAASFEGQLLRDGKVVFEADSFLRGLALARDAVLVGGSDVQISRSARGESDGHLWELDRGMTTHRHLRIPGGPVQDIQVL